MKLQTIAQYECLQCEETHYSIRSQLDPRFSRCPDCGTRCPEIGAIAAHEFTLLVLDARNLLEESEEESYIDTGDACDVLYRVAGFIHSGEPA